MHRILPLEQLDAARFDTPAILKKLASSSRCLAELKGIAGSTPNQGILISTLGMQEAKDSLEIEMGRGNYYVNIALNAVLLGNAG